MAPFKPQFTPFTAGGDTQLKTFVFCQAIIHMLLKTAMVMHNLYDFKAAYYYFLK